MNKKVFGKQLQKYREQTGFSQEKLAEMVNRSTIFISYMERGQKSPSLETLIQLANALNISTDLLLGSEVECNINSRLTYLETKVESLPIKQRQKVLDMFESLIDIELKYIKPHGEVDL